MTINNLIKFGAAVSKIKNKIAEDANSFCIELLEEKVIKNNYVSREEYDNLKELVISLKEKIAALEKELAANNDKNNHRL